jgi:hypothetical protein
MHPNNGEASCSLQYVYHAHPTRFIPSSVGRTLPHIIYIHCESPHKITTLFQSSENLSVPQTPRFMKMPSQAFSPLHRTTTTIICCSQRLQDLASFDMRIRKYIEIPRARIRDHVRVDYRARRAEHIVSTSYHVTNW